MGHMKLMVANQLRAPASVTQHVNVLLFLKLRNVKWQSPSRDPSDVSELYRIQSIFWNG